MALIEAEARQALQQLLGNYHNVSPEDRKQMSEASVVRQFVDRLLEEVLGWPIKDPARYKYELSTQVGRPDLTLFPETGGTIFIEAKRFGVIKELEQARYTIAGTITPGDMALPGMAVDRTAEEQQAINYAFSNGGTWAILTNFEKLRLFNARRDWLVLSFENPRAYLDDFDLLWQLSYHNVLNGSLDVLSNQRLRENVDTTYLNFINEWRERLAQDIIARSEENPWAFHNDGAINLMRLRAVVQRVLDRLVVIRFAEDHLVIPPGTLRQFYELRRNNIYAPMMDLSLEHFYRRFDENHNSALFANGLTDLASFSDGALLPLVAKLYEARYRSMPADIIGNTYEQYLGKALALTNGSITTKDNLETRKKQGSYYTPQVIVRYIVDNSLGRYLYGTENGRPDGKPVAGEKRKTSQDIVDLRVLDSACGSGSFLIYAYYVLAEFYETEIARIHGEINRRLDEMVAQGMNPIDMRIEMSSLRQELERIDNYPRLILEKHLYGVDLDPQAAEIAVVNLMMRAMERRQQQKRLPLILDQNVKVGNSLIGVRPDDLRMSEHQAAIAEIIGLRLLLHTDPDKGLPQAQRPRDLYRGMTLEDAYAIPNPSAREQAIEAIQQRRARPIEEIIDTANPTYYKLRGKTRAVADQLDAEFSQHFTDVERARPFHWGVEFPEVFYDENGQLLENPGFTIIFGNPPWEIVKPDLRELYAQFDEQIESKLTRKQVEKRIDELNAEDPRRKASYETQTAIIEQSAAYFQQSPDYTRQGRGDTATHKLFIERMYSLLHDTGRLGYIVPSGIYTDLGTKDLREMFFQTGRVEYMYGLANVRKFFPDVDSRFKFTLLGVQKGGQTDHFPVLFLLSHAGWPQINPERDAAAILADVLYDEGRVFDMSVKLVERFSPDSLSVMEFQSRHDYSIAEKIYDNWPLLGDAVVGTWNVKFTAEFHMTNDRHLFVTQPAVGTHGCASLHLPLYEGKMIHQFDAFFAEPQYWVDETKGRKRLLGSTTDENQNLSYRCPRLGVRAIARNTDERTLIATVLPPDAFAGNSILVGRNAIAPDAMLYLVAVLNNLCLDYILRFKVAANVNMFYLYQLPVPRLISGNPYFDAIVPRAARLTCVRPEFADLWQEVMGTPWVDPDSPLLEGEGPGVRAATGPTERQQLRDEIDAIAAHLYGLTRDEFDHILGAFPLVFPDTGEGQAKRERLLRVYDEWQSKLARI